MAIEKGHKVRHPKTLGRDRADRGNLGPRTATETAVPESEIAKKMRAAANAAVGGPKPIPVWAPGAASDVPFAF